MLDQLKVQMTVRQAKIRREVLERVRQWIRNAAEQGGVDATVNKPFYVIGGGNKRIDVEVWQGRAFVPDPPAPNSGR